MTKRRCNPSEADTPLGRWIWTEKETGEEFTTETAQQNDGTFLCFVVESPNVRASASTPEEATREVLRQMEERTNPETDWGESERETLAAIHRGWADYQAGRTISGREVFRKLRAKHGLPR